MDTITDAELLAALEEAVAAALRHRGPGEFDLYQYIASLPRPASLATASRQLEALVRSGAFDSAVVYDAERRRNIRVWWRVRADG
jgi:hypothetical protein